MRVFKTALCALLAAAALLLAGCTYKTDCKATDSAAASASTAGSETESAR